MIISSFVYLFIYKTSGHYP